MRLVESLNQGRLTTLPLKPGSRSVWFDLYDKMIDDRDCFVVIFDQEPASFSGSSVDLLEQARYICRPVKALPNGFEVMTMPGLYNVPGRNVVDYRFGSLPASYGWSTFRGVGVLTHGAVALSADPAGTYAPGLAAAVPRLEIFEAAAGHFGVSWRLDRLARAVWSTTDTDVFPAVPSLAVVDIREGQLPESLGGVPVVDGQITEFAAEAGHWTYYMVTSYNGGASEVSTNNAAPVGKALKYDGTPADLWEPGRTLDLNGVTDATEALNLTNAQLGRYLSTDGPRVSFGLSVGSLPGGDIEPGETVWVFAPDYRIEDASLAAVDVNGVPMRPRRFFVTSVDAPSHDAMCVVAYSSSTDTWGVPFSNDVVLDESGNARTAIGGSSVLPILNTDGGTARMARPIVAETDRPALVAAADGSGLRDRERVRTFRAATGVGLRPI